MQDRGTSNWFGFVDMPPLYMHMHINQVAHAEPLTARPLNPGWRLSRILVDETDTTIDMRVLAQSLRERRASALDATDGVETSK